MLICIRVGWFMSNDEQPSHFGNASKGEGPSANTETAECGVPPPMLGLSQCLRGPIWSKARVKEHKGAVRRQDENSLLALHCLTTDHAFDWDRASVHWKRDHETYALFYGGMKLYLHMCHSMRNNSSSMFFF